ncbi:hypothetical protein [Sediminimonas sp.]|jgi:uncharacterized protein YjiS (DUF1127 family)|uniref:hypothetical protein n=1 Tax=Sediminimonas sp. TaxID=2823379 RepID=UPI0025F378F8|nr:hypothetical protein [Sediminimonas sp.]
MTTHATDIRHQTPVLRNAATSLFAGIGRGFRRYLHQRSRVDQIEALNAKSDAELHQMGLTRDNIARHVFRDTFYI